MKKYRVLIPVFVWVSAEIEAEDEEHAREQSQDMDFSALYSPNKGGSIVPMDRDLDIEGGEPDYDHIEVYEVKSD